MNAADPVQVFDLRAEPVELERHRWSPNARRDPATLLGVLLHQVGDQVGTTAPNRVRYGEPLALARRALRMPYHLAYGATRAGVPVVVLAHPVEWYLFHGDAGNAHWISVAALGLFPYNEDRRVPARHGEAPTHGCASPSPLELAAEKALELAWALLPGLGDPHRLITHRQACNEPTDHLACPGELPVALALRALPVLDGRLLPDPDLVLRPGIGKPWPAAWRRHLTDRPVQPRFPQS